MEVFILKWEPLRSIELIFCRMVDEVMLHDSLVAPFDWLDVLFELVLRLLSTAKYLARL